MRLKGKLIKWDDAKGFGFIAPNRGGDHVFIHKTAFANRKRCPKITDVVTFSLSKDKQGRTCAQQATFSGEKLSQKKKQKTGVFSIYLSVIFLGGLLVGLVLNYLPASVVLLYLGASIVTYIVYGLDKWKAKRGVWRISENTMHCLALLGGWPGAALAQQSLRHKSQKKDFRIVFWLTVIINASLLGWLLSAQGAQYMRLLISL
ncbi:DUF1294 domain-containing protein [Thalassotalea piscium]